MMRKVFRKLWMFCVAIITLLLNSCKPEVEIVFTNTLEIPFEGIQVINLNDFKLKGHQLSVWDVNGNSIPVQPIDYNGDSLPDQLALKTSIGANSSTKYLLSKTSSQPSSTGDLQEGTFCRFVPERMDDFAWENNKVAFRVYGPECQKLFEQGNEGGLISSGVDCWLKRVDYPIINKWYRKDKKGGSYHKDEGEGLDNFHVGVSRGCGGMAIRYKGDFVYSKNFTEWEIIASGPLRSVFRLKYDPIFIDGKSVMETKTITMDLGDNYYRCDVMFEGDLKIDTLAIGLTLHEGLGNTDWSSQGWISYWEPIDDSEIGMGVWVNNETILGSEKLDQAGKDLNHNWLFAKVEDNRCTYFSGFGWKKSGEFINEESWKEYIEEQVTRLAYPIVTN